MLAVTVVQLNSFNIPHPKHKLKPPADKGTDAINWMSFCWFTYIEVDNFLSLCTEEWMLVNNAVLVYHLFCLSDKSCRNTEQTEKKTALNVFLVYRHVHLIFLSSPSLTIIVSPQTLVIFRLHISFETYWRWSIS